MVRRTFDQLRIGRNDAVAVARPKGTAEIFSRAVGNLPHSTLIYITDPRSHDDEVDKELVTVTPCDGFCESVLSSIECSATVHFIDLDVSPLLQRPRPACAHELPEFDDWSSLILGAEAFVELYHDHPSLRRRRIRPVDDWREASMAAELQRVHLRHPRVVVVCSVENVRGIADGLRRPLRHVDAPEFRGTLASIEPKASVVVQFLDDYPKVVARYWMQRTDSATVSTFDKMAHVMEEILDCAADDTSATWSLRHHRAFRRMLDGLMTQTSRTSLPLRETLDLVTACYNRDFAEAVRGRLLTFADARLPESRARMLFPRVPPATTNGPPPPADNSGPKAEERVLVRGICGRSLGFEEMTKGTDNFDRRLTWPGLITHHNMMRRRILRVATNKRLATSVDRYRGSLDRGLDMRRIMRASLRADPCLYVRRRRTRIDRESWFTGIVPILWFFASTEEGWQKRIVHRIWNSHDREEWTRTYLLGESWSKDVIVKAPGWPEDPRRLAIGQCELLVSYFEMGLTPSVIERDYPASARELPIEDHDGTDAARILQSIVNCASRDVLCVIPPSARVPATLSEYAARTGKCLTVLTHADAGTSDVKKLGRWVDVDNGGKPKTIENTREAVRVYDDMVKRFWW